MSANLQATFFWAKKTRAKEFSGAARGLVRRQNDLRDLKSARGAMERSFYMTPQTHGHNFTLS